MEALAHLFRPDSNDSTHSGPMFKWSHSERYFARKTSNNGGLLRLVAGRKHCLVAPECAWSEENIKHTKRVFGSVDSDDHITLDHMYCLIQTHLLC